MTLAAGLFTIAACIAAPVLAFWFAISILDERLLRRWQVEQIVARWRELSDG